jgi:hypothetical protein
MCRTSGEGRDAPWIQPEPVRRCGGPQRHTHARQATALRHGQLAKHISKVGGTQMTWLGEGGMGSFTEELLVAGAERPQGFQGNRMDRVWQTAMVCIVAHSRISIPESNSVGGVAGAGAEMRSGRGGGCMRLLQVRGQGLSSDYTGTSSGPGGGREVCEKLRPEAILSQLSLVGWIWYVF